VNGTRAWAAALSHEIGHFCCACEGNSLTGLKCRRGNQCPISSARAVPASSSPLRRWRARLRPVDLLPVVDSSGAPRPHAIGKSGNSYKRLIPLLVHTRAWPPPHLRGETPLNRAKKTTTLPSCWLFCGPFKLRAHCKFTAAISTQASGLQRDRASPEGCATVSFATRSYKCSVAQASSSA